MSQYEREKAAGATFVLLKPTETCPNRLCQKLAPVHAQFLPPQGAKDAHIRAFCAECHARRELGLARYGPRLIESFPEIVEFLDGKRKRSRSTKIGTPRFFSEFSWCCVYCEGSKLAAQFRISTLSTLGATSEYPPENLTVGLPGLETTLSETIRHQQPSENIFGLTEDHLIPIWIQQNVPIAWSDYSKRACEKSWVVSAHRSCNSARQRGLESTDFLLFVYSRYLFPKISGEMQRVDDLLAFADVLKQLETFRTENGLQFLAPAEARRAI